MNQHATTHTRTTLAVMTIASLVIAGCNDRARPHDPSLDEYARQSIAEQSRQNQVIASQATAVVESSHEIANSANNLVEQDAKARHELIRAYHDLSEDINRQQVDMHATRDEIEKERREMARLRHRDPILAASIQSFGGLLACLLPLGMAAFVVYRMSHQEPEHAAVAELLIHDLGSEKPAIWPCVQQQLTHQKGIGHANRHDSDPDDPDTYE
ncbi:MAG: hypothetical protein ACKO85_12890 [Isosphaeraceae bacterium]